MRRNKSVRPEWDTAFILAFFKLVSRRLENTASGYYHLELAIVSAEPCEDTFSNFANELNRYSTSFTFGRYAVLSKTGRT